MAFLNQEDENEKLRQGIMGGGTGSSSGAPAAKAPTRSGSWSNLQNYLGGGDTTANKITSGIDTETKGLNDTLTQAQTNASNLSGMYNNPQVYTNAQYQQATSQGTSPADYSKNVGTAADRAASLATTAGRFDALSKVQQPGASGGVTNLNQYLLSRGSSADKIGAYAQTQPDKIKQLSGSYEKSIGDINKTKENIAGDIPTLDKTITSMEDDKLPLGGGAFLAWRNVLSNPNHPDYMTALAHANKLNELKARQNALYSLIGQQPKQTMTPVSNPSPIYGPYRPE